MSSDTGIDAILDRAFMPVRLAIDAGRIPGAVLGLATMAGARGSRHAGHRMLTPERLPMHADTVFDLASLTKVVFTATRVLELAAEGRICLDDPLTVAIPDLRQYDVANAAERRLTFRDCLAHRTFLPAVEPIYTVGDDAARLRAYVLQREWRHGPPVYSDINYILLGIAIERLTGVPLSDALLPVSSGFTFRPMTDNVAATELCRWRERVMVGTVHDENAHALGGASGHAGLFGTADALLSFAHGIMTGTRLPAALTELLFTRVHLHRTAGWEIAHPGWSGGDLCPPTTIGHTGFTGTGLWIDRANGRTWTLLTNRVHPSRHMDSGILALRRAVGDAISAG